jgi:hypothetical protein
MKTAWIFPLNKRDGISLYSHRYVDCLKSMADVEMIDVSECLCRDFPKTMGKSGFDIVHIQYEPSFFIKHGRDSYNRLCRKIRVPIFVSLHEVYDQFPGVFPRESILGHGLLPSIKRKLYDLRHPAQTHLSRHCAHSFNAYKILVHYPFQRSILERKGVICDRITVLPLPVTPMQPSNAATVKFSEDRPLHLGATGFINVNYDYDMLFDTLEKLEMPWRFTWIGGLRRDEDHGLLADISGRIRRRSWQTRFTVTGWVTDEQQAWRLSSLDLFLALFRHRSSSASLATSFGAHIPAIATTLPMTQDLARENNIIYLVDNTAHSAAMAITRLAENPDLRRGYSDRIAIYAEQHSYTEMAHVLYGLYTAALS